MLRSAEFSEFLYDKHWPKVRVEVRVQPAFRLISFGLILQCVGVAHDWLRTEAS